MYGKETIQRGLSEDVYIRILMCRTFTALKKRPIEDRG